MRFWQLFEGGAGGKGVWGKPGLELEETGTCDDVRDPNYDSDSQVNSTPCSNLNVHVSRSLLAVNMTGLQQ